MSTKTTFKRIALVAVAALGLGVLSVAPSSATVTGLTVTVANGTAGLPGAASDSTTAATISLSGLMETGDSITVEFIAKSWPATTTGQASSALASAFNLDSSTGYITGYVVETLTSGTPAAAALGSAGSVWLKNTAADQQNRVVRISKTGGAANITHKLGFQLDSATTADGGADTRTAGTYTYTAIVKTYGGGSGSITAPVTTIVQDFSIVIAASAAVSTTAAAAKEFAVLGASAAPTSDGVDDVLTSVSTIGTVAGYLTAGVRNASDAQTAQDSVTASITGAGVLCQSTTCGKSFVLAATGDQSFTIKADGTAGVGTISVKTNVATFANKTVTFYAKAAKTITATVANPVLGVGANAGAVSIAAVDANGTNWTGTAYIVASSAADALVAGSATTPVACAAYTADDGILCPVTAIAAGTAKFKVIDASTVALATATSNEVTVTVSSAKSATVTLSFDKATYAPFEKAYIYVTPLDASGKNLPAVTSSALLAAGGITSTYAFSAGSDTLTASLISTSALTGVKKYTVYMPAASGAVKITATGGTALSAAGQVAVSATATVVNSSVDAATDAANEATDAANAATDAALAAADAADAATAAAQDASDAVAALSATVATLVASLKAQITSLTNLVIKIQKKVKA